MIESIDDNVSLVVARETMLQAEDMRRGCEDQGHCTGIAASPGWPTPWLGRARLLIFSVAVAPRAI